MSKAWICVWKDGIRSDEVPIEEANKVLKPNDKIDAIMITETMTREEAIKRWPEWIKATK